MFYRKQNEKRFRQTKNLLVNRLCLLWCEFQRKITCCMPGVGLLWFQNKTFLKRFRNMSYKTSKGR